MADLVSIVIVAHNNWPDLELAIESALWQSHPRIEVVIVDNASSDETEEMIRSRYSGVKYVRQENRLDGGGYNRGIEESRGNFVQLLDGDDLLAPNKIALQMQVFRERPDADIVYGNARQFSSSSGTHDWADWETRQQADMLMALIDPAGEGAGLVIHSALFRRGTLERVGSWEESFAGADMDYWIRAAWAGCRFVYSPDAWCFHRRRPGQMSAHPTAMVRRTISTLEKALEYIDREPYRSAVRKRLAGLRYGRALTDLTLEPEEARGLLRMSRSTDARRISVLSYALGRAVIDIPGARRAIKSGPMRAIRRAIARRLEVMD